MDHFCGKQPENLSRLLFRRLNYGHWYLITFSSSRLTWCLDGHTPGKHVWRVSGDFACSTQDQTISLSLRLVLLESEYLNLGTFQFLLFSSCSSEEFTCSDGVCIDLIKRSPFLFGGGGHCPCPLDRHKAHSPLPQELGHGFSVCSTWDKLTSITIGATI